MTVAPLPSTNTRLRLPRPPAGTTRALAPEADRGWIAMVGGCLLLAALSLLAPSEPTYDPMSWIVWGRELAHGTLDTVQGPSWKPLPVLFTTPFSLAGHGAAPALWLVVARAGGLLGIAMGFRLARRLAGWPAGVIAALAILATQGYVINAWRGNSEGLLVGLSLWAVERHLDGRRTWAFVLATAAALLRPEVWPFWGLYGLFVAWREPRRAGLVVALFALVPVAWFLPEYLGSGDFLRAASRARQPNLDSAAYAAFPALEVVRQGLQMVPFVVLAGAAVAFAAALRRRAGEHDHVVLVLAGAAVVLLGAVALMTQGGFSGNLRYLVLPASFACVLAGAGWVELVRFAGRRAGVLAAVAVVAAGVAGTVRYVQHERPEWAGQRRAAVEEALGVRDLPNLIARAGGRAAVNGCGRVYTTRFQVPAVAWELGRHLEDVDIFPLAPGVAIAPRFTALARDPRFPTYAGTTRWVAGRACGAD